MHKTKQPNAPGRRAGRKRVKLPLAPDVQLKDVWDDLTDKQRDQVVADEVASADAHVPDDPKDAALYRAALAKVREGGAARGRPKVGRGAAKFNVTMERSLLERVDAYAKQKHMTRAAVIASGVERLIEG
jgi:hypothetical protein